MVKKFITGLLGKKESGSQAQSEVPDELPPLAEDILKKEEPKKEIQQETAKAPEELPPLELTPHAQQENAADSELGTLHDLDFSGSAGDDKPADKKAGFAAKEMAKQETNNEMGFFSNLLEHLNKHDLAKEKLLSGDLFLRMSNYWDLKRHEIRSGKPLPTEKKLEGDLAKKLEDLKILEHKWQVQRLALEEDIKFLHEREKDIQSKINELTLISNELGLFRNVKPSEYFILKNGMLLKNLHDLIDALEILDDDTYAHHVTGRKNDFSSWIMDVFREKSLSDKIKNANSRAQMIEILQTIPVIENSIQIKEHAINPKKYFWLHNGAVIRSLHELMDALQAIDDETYQKHVTQHKNDFAKWVKDVLRNDYLAEKLKACKSRKEMVQILEIFL